MPIDGRLPGLLEAQRVEPVHVHSQLVDVVARGLFIQGVEQHALLHRRQRVEVFDLGQRHRQAVQLLLVQTGQREVRRRRAALARLAAMRHQGLEFRGIVIRQALDSRGVEHLCAEGPAQAQLTAIDPPSRLSQLLSGASGLWSSPLASPVGLNRESCSSKLPSNWPR